MASDTWETFRDPDSGRVYYANRETGDASWNPPPPSVPLVTYPHDDILRNWRAYRSPAHANELFFLNILTKERTWNRPFKFRGMPEGEDEDHEKGPFIRYEDEQDRLYYYNPRTKLVTRTKPSDPKTIISEQAAYEELRRKGELWLGRAEKQQRTADKHSDSDESSSDDSSSSSDEGSSSSDGEGDKEPVKEGFIQMLRSKGVVKISKWQNWVSKLQGEPQFQSSPPEKVREWFEDYVKSLVQSDSSSKAKAISELKESLESFVRGNATERLSMLTSADVMLACESLDATVREKLRSLSAMERNAVLAAVRKRCS